MQTRPVFLFDIDGVLIESRGYREAYLNTIRSFFEQFGVSSMSPSAAVHEAFEHSPYTAEWDMAPITIAAFLDWYAARSPFVLPYPKLNEIRGLNSAGDQKEFERALLSLIPRLEGILEDSIHPTAALFVHCRNEKESSIFPHLWNENVLAEILQDSFNRETALIFQRLELFLIGSANFEKLFKIKSPFETVSNLSEFDVPLLSMKNREVIRGGAGRDFFVSAITARPNYPGSDLKAFQFSALPEAETAMAQLGLDLNFIPVIGAGSVNAFEAQRAIPINTYLKPNPVHALTGFFAAIGFSAGKAFETAETLVSNKKLPQDAADFIREKFSGSNCIDVAVFEDSVTGIRSACEAENLLNHAGIPVRLYKAGIMTTDNKNDRLLAAGAKLYPDVNQALSAYCRNSGLFQD